MKTAEVEQACNILGTLPEKYPLSTEEQDAVKLAAYALLHIWQSDIIEQFQASRKRFNTPLTPTQISMLKDIGVNFD